MVLLIDCYACRAGDHEHHTDVIQGTAPGVIGGARCPCQGECAVRAPTPPTGNVIGMPDQPNVSAIDKTGTRSTFDPATGKWIPATPLGPQGVIARLEFWLRARGCRRAANLLGRIDEIGLG